MFYITKYTYEYIDTKYAWKYREIHILEISIYCRLITVSMFSITKYTQIIGTFTQLKEY